MSFGVGYEIAKGLTIEMSYVFGSVEYITDADTGWPDYYYFTLTEQINFGFLMMTANILSF